MANVWCADDTFLGDLIYIGSENLIVDSPDENKLPSIRDALLAGQAPAAVIGSDAVNIPLHAVKKISTDRHDQDIEIVYAKDKEDAEQTLRLASPEKRDEVFAALKQVFGNRFEVFEEAYTRPQALAAPLMSLTFFAFLTLVFAGVAGGLGEAQDDDASGKEQLFVWLIDLVGPVGVWIVGGILCALSLAAVVLAAKRPPVMLTLQEPPYRPKSNVMLVVKYIGIAFGWFLVFRLIQGM